MANNRLKRQKLEFYILSIFLLFFILFLIKVPYDFTRESEFIGFKSLFFDYPIIVVCVIGMIIGAICFFRFIGNYETGTTLLPMNITKIHNVNFESVTFLATYIVPLACIDLDKERSCLMLVTILILIGWIYIKTNLFYTNPTLAIWGYHIYKINAENSHEKKEDLIIIVRKKLALGDQVKLKEIDDEIYLAK